MNIIDCKREDCIIEDLGSRTTLLGWTPTYNKQGQLLNSDPNITTTYYRCIICKSNWQTKK